MVLQAHYRKVTFNFTFDAGTSRGVLRQKDSYFILLEDLENPGPVGVGEAAPLVGLSMDDCPEYETYLKQLIEEFNHLEIEAFLWNIPIIIEQLIDKRYPSVRFGFEVALYDLLNGGKRNILPNEFVAGRPIEINGLVWMGEIEFMQAQVERKLAEGFKTLKFKIGALNLDEELGLLHQLRTRFKEKDLTIRVDANGAFSVTEVGEVLHRLKRLGIHSIEQPITAGQPEAMARLCHENIVPIALDEELIGVVDYVEAQKLLRCIAPQFIILKPTLVGGITATLEWIELAGRIDAGWWITSALESNIGLNAITQLTSSLKTSLPQGLGTGQLYANNIDSPLEVRGGHIYYNTGKNWDLSPILSS